MSYGKTGPLNLLACEHDDDDDDDNGDGGGDDEVVRHLLISGSAGVECLPPPTCPASCPLSCHFPLDHHPSTFSHNHWHRKKSLMSEKPQDR